VQDGTPSRVATQTPSTLAAATATGSHVSAMVFRLARLSLARPCLSLAPRADNNDNAARRFGDRSRPREIDPCLVSAIIAISRQFALMNFHGGTSSHFVSIFFSPCFLAPMNQSPSQWR